MENELKIDMDKDQKKLFSLIENSNDIIFISGEAGVGKSYFLQQYVKNTIKDLVVLASTGTAALNVGGQTVHSFFQLEPAIQDINDERSLVIGHKLRNKINCLDCIIIDEASMLTPDIVEMINKKCQIARNSSLPFGGIQVLFFGDLYQLAPVVKRANRKYYKEIYNGEYFFNAPVIKDKLVNYELSIQHRQNDKEFIKNLNNIRKGKNIGKSVDYFNSRNVEIPTDTQSIILTTLNDNAFGINYSKLNKIDSLEVVYKAEVTGKFNENDYPTEYNLYLKKGAQVMLLQNDLESPRRWANGTLATVTALDKDFVTVKIKKNEYVIERNTWKEYEYEIDEETQKLEKKVKGTFTQFPVRLAWAITIHKSQGKTYDAVVIDFFRGAFAAGQAYVALSRCKNIENIYLKYKIRPEDIKINEEVINYYKTHEIKKVSSIK